LSVFSDPNSREIEADRSSISSWSMMSGQNEGNGNSSTPIQVLSMASSPQNGAPESLPRDSPPLPHIIRAQSNATYDHGLLMDKISSLQESRMTLEERVHMLENSAAGMADELLKKSAIIQYYCMETKKKGKNLY
jgi:hypothetical protein